MSRRLRNDWRILTKLLTIAEGLTTGKILRLRLRVTIENASNDARKVFRAAGDSRD